MTPNKNSFDHISPYHVSLCSSLGEKLLTPNGSRTFAKFSIPSDTGKKTVYGILTSKRVLENIELVTHKKFGGLKIFF